MQPQQKRQWMRLDGPGAVNSHRQGGGGGGGGGHIVQCKVPQIFPTDNSVLQQSSD